MEFNILITSISSKIPLIKAARHAFEELGLNGTIIGGDCCSPCIGSFFVDEFWKMPMLEELAAEELLALCQERAIRVIIPSRDGELAFFAEQKELFHQQGIAIMISPLKSITTCVDKELFFHFLKEQQFPCIETKRNIQEIEADSYVVKEQFGSGSRKIGINLTKEQAIAWASGLQQPIFQPYVQGREYSVDLYTNKEGTVHAAVARRRDFVIRGESHITTSFKDPEMERLCSEIAEALGLYGHAVIQLIREDSGKLSIIECNPRFGGASTLSIAMGLNSFAWFFLECLGHLLPPFIRSSEEKQQVRYACDLILNHPSSIKS